MKKETGHQVKFQIKFQRHTSILMWKCYLQRRRRWRALVMETVFASLLFCVAVWVAKPVFLTPLQAEPEAPLTTADLLASLRAGSILGYAPDEEPYTTIMSRAAGDLGVSFMSAATENQLNSNLYRAIKLLPDADEISVLWVIWKPRVNNTWQFSIRSTDRARYQTVADFTSQPNPHLRAGFLAVQVAVSQAIVDEYAGWPTYEVRLVSMPVSPLMQQGEVKKALSIILLCFTVAFIPPVLETQALVVQETISRFKRSLRIRGVSYSSMYLGWLMYAGMTALPICFLAAITLLLIFRWIHLFVALSLMLAYVSAMYLTALIMAMFHSKTWVACVWSSLFTLLQTYMAELLVHHEYDVLHGALTFLLHLTMPPLGLVHAMNHFALLSTGKQEATTSSLWYSYGSWGLLILLYFVLLLILQRTIGHERAIGGQVSWKSIIFKKVEDVNALHEIDQPTGRERDKLQEVDELVAKAISFRNVSKSIMGFQVLKNITMDIYRGEFTLLFAERVQEKLIHTAEDLLCGLAFPDHGSINVLGTIMRPGVNVMTESHMMGYCHRSNFLIEDLTVAEHFTLFNEICLWQESRLYIRQYGLLRTTRLTKECHLELVQNELVSQLDMYYRAQLCWAIAMLLEPRVVILPNFSDQHPRHTMVIKDKIMQYRKYITLVDMCFSSLQLEFADRVFIFDTKVVAFGGTPAFMFFKYGREYRVRMNIRSDGSVDDESTKALKLRAAEAGATIRAHFGALLILRLPTEPTDVVAKLIKDLVDNSDYYGMLTLHISVPDSEEVYRRAMMESRAMMYKITEHSEEAKNALKRMAETQPWERQTNCMIMSQLSCIGWKYFSFHVYYRLYFLITLISAMLAGIFIGLSLSNMLTKTERDEVTRNLLLGEKLTMEFTKAATTLALRADAAHNYSISLASAYVFSEPNAKENDIELISYTALAHTESLTEYLVTRAIDSPQTYVSLFAYGLDIQTGEREKLLVNALYSPLHRDYGAAARSLAKTYTALLRHYSGSLDASIQITDDPLALDLTPWMKYATKPPLFVQFLLILVISHITILPSMEHGFIRHNQSHAMNFSPVRYWLMLYFWDLVLYWLLVGVMSGFMVLMMYLVAPRGHFLYGDLLVVPFILILYGFACVPQAYLFSLGPRVALNSMTFIIVNIVFGETTIIAQTFYGDVLKYALLLMSLSPQFNFAYAFVKIKQIFLYNSECFFFQTQNLCTGKILHKCCQKCGVLQECYKKRNYLTLKPGILTEVLALISIAVFFTIALLVVEYAWLKRAWLIWNALPNESPAPEHQQPGTQRTRERALDKLGQIKRNRIDPLDTFGERLLVCNLTRKELGTYMIHSVYLGVARGQAVAISGLKRHGRQKLLDMLAGYTFPDAGHAVCMSKWNVWNNHHKYARQIALSCGRAPMPRWMTVYDALTLLALLRGVPQHIMKDELRNVIEALEIQEQADTLVCRITSKTDRIRLCFAAAIVGAPPILIVDECTAYQKFSVRRSMYSILHQLRRRGHSIITAASNVEAHMPMTDRLAIILDGTTYDVDTVDNMVARYSKQGYTVVLHLKDDVDVNAMFARHFSKFLINDTSEVLVNVQILDQDLNWGVVFERMENLKQTNNQVYSYIVTAIPIDYIYNSILNDEKGNKVAKDLVSGWRFRKKTSQAHIQPSKDRLEALRPFEQKYDIIKLRELPWSVIFQT